MSTTELVEQVRALEGHDREELGFDLGVALDNDALALFVRSIIQGAISASRVDPTIGDALISDILWALGG